MISFTLPVAENEVSRLNSIVSSYDTGPYPNPTISLIQSITNPSFPNQEGNVPFIYNQGGLPGKQLLDNLNSKPF